MPLYTPITIKTSDGQSAIQGSIEQVFEAAKRGDANFFTTDSTFKKLSKMEQTTYLTATDDKGNTPMHYAATHGDTMLKAMDETLSLEAIQRLNDNKQTPAQYAEAERARVAAAAEAEQARIAAAAEAERARVAAAEAEYKALLEETHHDPNWIDTLKKTHHDPNWIATLKKTHHDPNSIAAFNVQQAVEERLKKAGAEVVGTPTPTPRSASPSRGGEGSSRG